MEERNGGMESGVDEFSSVLTQLLHLHRDKLADSESEMVTTRKALAEAKALVAELQEVNRAQSKELNEKHLAVVSRDLQIEQMSRELLSLRQWRDQVMRVVTTARPSEKGGELLSPPSHLSSSSPPSLDFSSTLHPHSHSPPQLSSTHLNIYQPFSFSSSSSAARQLLPNRQTTPDHPLLNGSLSQLTPGLLRSPQHASPSPPSPSSSSSASADDTFNLERSIFADPDSGDELPRAEVARTSLNRTFPTSFGRTAAPEHQPSSLSFDGGPWPSSLRGVRAVVPASAVSGFARESAFFEEARRCLSSEAYAGLLALVKEYTTDQLLQPRSAEEKRPPDGRFQALLGAENEHLYHWLMRLFTPTNNGSKSWGSRANVHSFEHS